MVVVGMPVEPVELGMVTLAGGLENVREGREFLRGLTTGMVACDDVVMAGDELVTNAVLHTASGWPGGTVTVRLAQVGPVLRLEVGDAGAGGKRPYLKSGDDQQAWESGRGIRILDALATRWGYREDGERTIVWAEFSP